MPDSDEGEDGEVTADSAKFTLRTAAEGNVQVAETPFVEGAVPAAPELHDAVVVGHAADHVFGRVDAVE